MKILEDIVVNPVTALRGTAAVPGDKSISQRAALLASLAHGVSVIDGYLEGEDALNTLAALGALGARIERSRGRITIEGVGEEGFRDPEMPLDLANSGTGLRLLLGALAGQPVFATLTGDGSLRRRPMGRVTEPLKEMGASLDGRDGGNLLPLAVRGGGLRALRYVTPIASAQVKSAILLAGLGAQGTTQVKEPALSRDHTERMLPLFGATVRSGPGWAEVDGPQALRAVRSFTVPKDPSSAAFPLVAALLVSDGDVRCAGMSVNPTRRGWLDILERMGAEIHVTQSEGEGGEPVGDVRARASSLSAVTVSGEIIPRSLDEIPILCVAAARASGTTVIRDAAELRVKESDRLHAIRLEWEKLGLAVKERPDGLEIAGPQRVRGGRCTSHGDHRIAMALVVAGLVADAPVTVEDAGCIRTSFPNYVECMQALGASLSWRRREGSTVETAK